MKKLNAFKKILALTVSAFMLAVLPNSNVLTASAEEHSTYYVMYLDDQRDWYFQEGDTWNNDIPHSPVFYMEPKNGDIVIVGNGGPNTEPLKINVHLGNLTIANNGTDTFAVVSVEKGIDNCYFLGGSYGSVTGNVFNAYVYDSAVANFNNNVSNLYSYNSVGDNGPTVGVGGTVTYFEADDTEQVPLPFGADFGAGTFSLRKGELTTAEDLYIRDISIGPVTFNAQAASQPASSRPAASGSSADEYDKVPKTGENSPIVWLALITVSCFGASLILRKSANR